jgi:hypothetical protein
MAGFQLALAVAAASSSSLDHVYQGLEHYQQGVGHYTGCDRARLDDLNSRIRPSPADSYPFRANDSLESQLD